MLVAATLERVFLMEENEQTIKLSDPESTFSPQAVLNFYANTYPILTTATIKGPQIEDDTIQYTFVSTMGTKG